MPDYAILPVADLLVDEQNPRLSRPSSGQKEAIEALAETQDRKLLNQSQGGMCICRVLGIWAGVSRECFGP